MPLPSWVIVSLPLCVLLATLFFVWRFMRRGTMAVHRAAAKGNVARLEQLLLANPASANGTDLVGFTPLQYAACWGQVEAARLLLDNDARLTVDSGWSPLHHAAAEGHEDVVRLLLERGADVNTRSSSDGSSPLHGAVINRRADLVRLLLDHGADVEAKTKSDWTACHFAASSGDEATLTVLLEHGADWRATNSANQSPLELAMANNHPRIVNLV
ncbi:MAG: ankyrin repeat domain-containing protein, partial [Pirellulales bacterium]|nr:ankyrin repeat domain-containing protein [Pirellulales bacterium]